MDSRIPRISVGLPVYNGEAYLPAALTSLLKQDYGDFELIVSDNASTDGTEAICRDFAAKDPRIRYSRNETNIGAARNYNRVFELSRSQLFKWASHDDECHPSLLRRCVEVFDTAPPSTALVYSRAEIIDENGAVKMISPDSLGCPSSSPVKRLAKVVYRSWYAHPLWGVIRSEALRGTRLMGCLEADHVLLAELSLQGQLVEIPEILYKLRRHSRSAMVINRSARELLAWHDPSRARDRIVLPHWEGVYLEYLRGIRHTSLPSFTKLLCYGTIPTVCYWRRFLKWSGPLRARMGLSRMARRQAKEGVSQPHHA